MWINEQLQVAMSEDYGTDYEHLKVYICRMIQNCLQNKCYKCSNILGAAEQI